MTPPLRPVYLADPHCGTDDRILYAAALVCLAVLVAGVWVVRKVVR